MYLESQKKRKRQKDLIRFRQVNTIFNAARRERMQMENQTLRSNSKKGKIQKLLAQQPFERSEIQELWECVCKQSNSKGDDERLLSELGLEKILGFLEKQRKVFRLVKQRIEEQKQNQATKNAYEEELEECENTIMEILWIVGTESDKLSDVSEAFHQRLILSCIDFIVTFVPQMKTKQEEAKSLSSIILGNMCFNDKASKMITEAVNISDLIAPELNLLETEDFSFCMSNIMYYYPETEDQRWAGYEQQLSKILCILSKKVYEQIDIFGCQMKSIQNRFYFLNDIFYCIIKVRILLSNCDPIPNIIQNSKTLKKQNRHIGQKLLQITSKLARIFNRNAPQQTQNNRMLMHVLIFIRDTLRLANFQQFDQNSLEAHIFAHSQQLLQSIHWIVVSEFGPNQTDTIISNSAWEIMNLVMTYLQTQNPQEVLSPQFSSSQMSNISVYKSRRSLFEAQLRWIEMRVIKAKPFRSIEQERSKVKSSKQISSDQLSRALEVFVNHLKKQSSLEGHFSLLELLLALMDIYVQDRAKPELMLALDGIQKIVSFILEHPEGKAKKMRRKTILDHKYEAVESLLYKFSEQEQAGDYIHSLVHQIIDQEPEPESHGKDQIQGQLS